ncbi:hypothetical protein A6R68_07706, partial [Neotoma lepida]
IHRVGDKGRLPTPLSLVQPLARFQAHLEALGCLARSKGPPSLVPALLTHHPHLVPDTKSTIEKICDFLGKKLEPDELDMVLKYSSF